MQEQENTSFLGIKGFILLLIVFYHLFNSFLPGAYISFAFVFVFMGFTLMDSYINTKIRPGPFLVKGIKRAWIPQFIFIFFLVLYFALMHWKEFPLWRNELVASLFFFQNIYQILHLSSYFSHKITFPISHLWIISVYFQLLLLWYILILGKKSKQKIVNLGFIALVVCLLSFINSIASIFYIKDLGDYLLRIENYLFPFGLGLVFSLYANNSRFKSQSENKDMLIGFFLIVLILLIFALQGPIFVEILGFLISSFIFALVLSLLHQEKALFAGFFQNKFLQFVGKRSYHYFIWQYWLDLTIKRMDFFQGQWIIYLVLVELLLLFVLGEFSHWLTKKFLAKKSLLLLSLLIFSGIILVSFFSQKESEVESFSQILNKKPMVVKNDPKKKISKTPKNQALPDKESYRPSNEVEAAVEQINARFPQYRLNFSDLEKLQSQAGAMIGDESTLDTEEEYHKLMPRVQYDGGRDKQLYQVVDQVKAISQNMGNTNTPIILQFGTKADFNRESLEEVIGACEGQRIILINLITKEPWEDSVNDKLKMAAEKYENVFLVDWHQVAKDQGDLFEEESGKLKKSGKRLLTQMVARSLLSTSISENQDKKGIER